MMTSRDKMKAQRDIELADDYIAKGYRVTSNRHCIISRIDREDWVHHLKECTGIDTVDDTILEEHWCDYYRRCISKDNLTVDQHVCRLIPNSSYDTTGFVRMWKPRAKRRTLFEQVSEELKKYVDQEIRELKAGLPKAKRESLIKPVTFGNLEVGDTFTKGFTAQAYMKCHYNVSNTTFALNMSNGGLWQPTSDMPVQLISHSKLKLNMER